MRIQGMDATIRQNVNVTTTEAKPEVTAEPAKLQESAARGTAKDERFMESADKVSDAFIKKAIDRVNHSFEIERRSLRFQIHERLNEVMVKVIDTETEEVIREIPPEKLLDMFASMLELAGLLVDEKR